MPRYKLKLLIYPSDGGSEVETETHVTADDAVAARRRAIEIAQYNGNQVSRFLSVTKKETKS